MFSTPVAGADDVVAALAVDGVVARAAVEIIVERAARENVVAHARRDLEALTILHRAARDAVPQHGKAVRVEDRGEAGVGIALDADHVGEHGEVRAGAAVEAVIAAAARAVVELGDQNVVAGAAEQRVGVPVADQDVVAVIAVERVGAVRSIDRIVAAVAMNDVVGTGSDQKIVTRPAVAHVSPRRVRHLTLAGRRHWHTSA